MRRITLLLLSVCVMAMAVPAAPAQESHGESDGSAAAAPAPALQTPPAPAEAPAANAPLAENQKITGTVVATPANAIVIRNDAGVDVTFHVESTSMLPKNMRIGEKATIVYRGTEGGQPVAFLITMAPPPKPDEPPAPKNIVERAAVGVPASVESSAPSRPAGGAPVGAAPTATESHGAVDAKPPAVPSTSEIERAAKPAAGNETSGVEKPPVLPEPTTDSALEAAPSAAPGAGEAAADSTSPQPDTLWGMSRAVVPVVVVGGMLFLGVVFGVWSYAKRSDQASSTALGIK